MHLNEQGVARFFKLWFDLLWSINEKHGVVPHFPKPIYNSGKEIDKQLILTVRDKIWENPAWIDEFLAETGNTNLSQQDRAIIQGWRNGYIKGTFIAAKQRAKGAMMIHGNNEPPLVYTVSGISDSIKDTLPWKFPVIFDTVLLPFCDRIIYDSLITNPTPVTDIADRNQILQSYDHIKNKRGIIEMLDTSTPSDGKIETITQKTNTANSPKIPNALMGRYEEIAAMITAFCHVKLDDEYLGISLHVLEKLCRKRPSPIQTGWAKTWACGIVYAVGSVNFIFDPANTCHMSAEEISSWFGISRSTAGNKSSQVIDILRISRFSPEYMIRSNIDNNPAIWFVKYGGMIVDIRKMPLEIQRAAFEQGIIPYVPTKQEG